MSSPPHPQISIKPRTSGLSVRCLGITVASVTSCCLPCLRAITNDTERNTWFCMQGTQLPWKLLITYAAIKPLTDLNEISMRVGFIG